MAFRARSATTASVALRSTLTPRLVNEVRAGMSGGPSLFNPNMSPGMFSGSVYNMDGYTLGIERRGSPTPRFLHGQPAQCDEQSDRGHADLEQGVAQLEFRRRLLTVRRIVTSDSEPADPQRHPRGRQYLRSGPDHVRLTNGTNNFPGASSSQLGDARDMYGVLGGSVTSFGRHRVPE